MRRLREERPEHELFFIIGADQFAELDTWREPEEIARLARLVVIPRGGTEPGAPPPGLDVEYDVVDVTRIGLSSTD
ncbi:MAG: nicotinic acid mononucleotide adenylyltransferase, partial [Gemmatimonadetes bacterium]|nr:nicotinic acid mononucleotide adenylyltransferase [Gemmatimonadota bacterium]